MSAQGALRGGEARAALSPRGPMMPGRIERAKNPRGTVRRLVAYFGHYKPRLALVFALIVAYTLLGLLGPYLMGRAIDQFIAQKDAAGLARIALAMGAAFAAGMLLQALAGWVMAEVSQSALKELRADMFGHLQKLPLRFFDQNPAGELMSRLTNDIDAINQAVSQNITTLFGSVLTMVGILITMFVLDKWLALASLLVVPIMIWFTQFVARYTRKGFKRLQADLGGLNGVMEESIGGQRVVKAFRRNASVVENFERQNQVVYESGVYANNYALLLMPLTTVLGNLFVIVLAGLGAVLALQGLVTIGVIATFINYGQNFVSPLRQLSNLYNTIQGALAGAERVFDLLDTPVEIDASPGLERRNSLRGAIVFDNVKFEYEPGVPVLKGMSLRAKPGEIVALVGPTGAGKTTIINLLTRFYEINSGGITIDGVDIREIPKAELRAGIGLVLQDTYLFSNTVMENIRYGRLAASDAEVVAAAKLADADYFINLLPQGYQTVLSERASNLSQGQRQLLSITRAILADPAILILDEATSSVDTRTEAHIQKALLRLMQGRTSFVIAHRLSTIRDADQVLVIDHGEIIERGTHQQLLDMGGLYQRLYVSQFKGQAI